MAICKLLKIEMDTNKFCPAISSSTIRSKKDRFFCYEDCGFSPLRNDEKSKNRKRSTLKIQKRL